MSCTPLDDSRAVYSEAGVVSVVSAYWKLIIQTCTCQSTITLPASTNTAAVRHLSAWKYSSRAGSSSKAETTAVTTQAAAELTSDACTLQLYHSVTRVIHMPAAISAEPERTLSVRLSFR